MKEKIKNLRIKNLMSCAEFSRELRVSPWTVHTWEKGISKPSKKNIERIIERFSLPKDYFEEGNVLKKIGSYFKRDK